MQLTKEMQGDCAVVIAQGRLDNATSPQFEKDLIGLIGNGEQAFVFEMASVTFVSSAGLRVLLSMAKRVARHHARIVVSSPSDVVKAVFEISNFGALFTICATRQEAVAEWLKNQSLPAPAPSVNPPAIPPPPVPVAKAVQPPAKTPAPVESVTPKAPPEIIRVERPAPKVEPPPAPVEPPVEAAKPASLPEVPIVEPPSPEPVERTVASPKPALKEERAVEVQPELPVQAVAPAPESAVLPEEPPAEPAPPVLTPVEVVEVVAPPVIEAISPSEPLPAISAPEEKVPEVPAEPPKPEPAKVRTKPSQMSLFPLDLPPVPQSEPERQPIVPPLSPVSEETSWLPMASTAPILPPSPASAPVSPEVPEPSPVAIDPAVEEPPPLPVEEVLSTPEPEPPNLPELPHKPEPVVEPPVFVAAEPQAPSPEQTAMPAPLPELPLPVSEPPVAEATAEMEPPLSPPVVEPPSPPVKQEDRIETVAEEPPLLPAGTSLPPLPPESPRPQSQSATASQEPPKPKPNAPSRGAGVEKPTSVPPTQSGLPPLTGPCTLSLEIESTVLECRDGDVIGSDGTLAKHLFTGFSPRHALIGKDGLTWFIMVPRNVVRPTFFDGTLLPPGQRQTLTRHHRIEVNGVKFYLVLKPARRSSSTGIFAQLKKLLFGGKG